MNIFVLDRDPEENARYHCDSHVVKMILESAQLLSTAHHILGDGGPYKKTHENHPCAVWVRESAANYTYLWFLMLCLGKEYTFRYNKTHKTILDHKDTLRELPSRLLGVSMTEFPKCMPEEYKKETVVDSYRTYYKYGKADLLKYTRRNAPFWLNKIS
jgi:hypothetical protein